MWRSQHTNHGPESANIWQVSWRTLQARNKIGWGKKLKKEISEQCSPGKKREFLPPFWPAVFPSVTGLQYGAVIAPAARCSWHTPCWALQAAGPCRHRAAPCHTHRHGKNQLWWVCSWPRCASACTDTCPALLRAWLSVDRPEGWAGWSRRSFPS